MKKTIKSFSKPSAEYRGKPFWSWNGELRGEELKRQAKVMKEMGFGGFFMHSRAGLITEYLGDKWFDLINEVADLAEEIGMEAWLYDEDRWPSGSAGGKVTLDPEYRMKSLYVYETVPEKIEWNDESFALYVAKMDGINVYTYKELDSSEFKCSMDAVTAAKNEIAKLSDERSGEWKALRFAIVPDAPSSNYNGTTYIDTMSRKATDRFIELTHIEYEKHCGSRLGKSIKGIFTDEPHRGQCFGNRNEHNGVVSCAVAWTDDIFDEFEKRYGFSCRNILPELFYRKNGEKVAPIKLHYIDLANALFLERFAKPINDWCNEHNIIFTGHVLHEDSLMNQTVPNGSLMRFYEHMGYPGVDCLTEHNRCYWIVKQLSSAARQLGQKWLLSELYGCTGWQFNFKSHKAVGDWQALFGINLRCHHLSWYTMEGEAKRDYPASILHQSPWYKDYSKVEDYFARMGVVLTQGNPVCDVLLLNPIESVWCQAYSGWASWIFNNSADISPIEQRYAEIFHFLTDNQIDFDYGEEEMMSRLASVEIVDGTTMLRVGKAVYKTVIVSNMLTIRPTTLSILDEFMKKGGKVIFSGDLPEYVNAVKSYEPAKLSEGAVVIPYGEKELVDAVRECTDAYVSVTNEDGNTEKAVFAQVRKNFGGDGYAVVILNTDRDNPRKNLTLALRAPKGMSVEEWNFETGFRYNASSVTNEENGIYYIKTDLEAAGTRCFVLTTQKEMLPDVVHYETAFEAELTGKFDYTTDEPNAIVLDRCKWRWGNGEWHEEDEVLRVDRKVRSDVGIEWRGGEMLQPWYAKKYDKKQYGKLELSYEFYVEKLPEGEIFLAGERPELNCYKLNGVDLKSTDVNDFWIDDCFKKMYVPVNTLKLGRNEVTIDVTFMRTTNLEAVYLIGNFGVKLDGVKRIMTEAPSKMGCDNYSAYNMPFYTGNLTFILKQQDYANILGDAADNADRIMLTPKDFTGGCVKVETEDKTEILGWEPYEADITDAYRKGLPIKVTVEGVRTNLFGPLHEVTKPADSCGPGNFVTSGDAWTDSYSQLSSGVKGFIFKCKKCT